MYNYQNDKNRFKYTSMISRKETPAVLQRRPWPPVGTGIEDEVASINSASNSKAFISLRGSWF